MELSIPQKRKEESKSIATETPPLIVSVVLALLLVLEEAAIYGRK